ncbi:MAG: hypothetical protein ABJM43_09855 [Paracoccaceae bacterium]
MLRLVCSLTLICGLASCATFPELDSSFSPAARTADFPALVPLEPLLAQNAGTGTNPQETVKTLEGRLASLRARAARLRGPVLDRASRARLAESPI